MVGAASWGMLQAQASNAANVNLKDAPALKESVETKKTPIVVVPSSEDHLRMSYQLEEKAQLK